MFDLPHEIKTPRLILKRPTVSFDFAKQVYAQVDKSRDYIAPWLDWAFQTNKVEDSYDFLSYNDTTWNNKTECAYAIFKDTVFMGFITVLRMSTQNKSAKFGYWLGKDFNGNGYMAEAIKSLESILFKNGVNRLIIGADANNKKSQNVAQKSGYTQEAYFRQSNYSKNHNLYRDIIIFAKLKQDFDKEK